MAAALLFSVSITSACSSEQDTEDGGAPDGAAATDAGSAALDGGQAVDSGTPDSGPAPECGNNRIEAGEACDDGNMTSGDGCSATCTPEDGALGCRSLTISAGKDGSGADNSAYFNTALNPNTDISEFLGAGGWNPGGPLVLCAGAIAAGKAELTLESDVTVAVSLPLSNCLCRQYVAAGTHGTLYCAASADPLDFKVSSDSMASAPAGAPTIVAGASAVRGEGDLRITFQSRAANLDADAAGCNPSACAAVLAAESLSDVEYTTGVATSEVLNPRQGGVVSIETSGSPFDDDPNDGTADCEDWTSAGPLGALAGAASFDEDNTDLGNERDIVTVERIAE